MTHHVAVNYNNALFTVLFQTKKVAKLNQIFILISKPKKQLPNNFIPYNLPQNFVYLIILKIKLICSKLIQKLWN